MGKFISLAAILLAVSTLGLCGCSKPEQGSDKANAALRAEVKEILETIHSVDKDTLSPVDRGDIVNSDILEIIRKYNRLCELTGISFYSWVLSSPGTDPASQERFKKLTETNPKLIPFYAEDEVSGTLYFAAPPEQEFIIKKYKDWFAKNGETFDFYALQKARTKQE